MKKQNKVFQLFFTFLKIGAFTFGGGYAMIPIIQKEVVEKKKWITDNDILEIIAIAESTPGPIAINSATFVGYKTAGFLGSLFATLGVVIPSFIIILLVSFLLDVYGNLEIVQFAFNGIRCAVLALIIKALISMFKKSPKNLFSYFVIGFAFIMSAIFRLNVLYIIIACAVLGFIFSYISLRRAGK